MLKDILLLAVEQNASDIHITTNMNVALRVNQRITVHDIFTSTEDVIDMCKMLTGSRFGEIQQLKQLDVGGSIFGVRYRANIFLEKGSYAIAIRVIHNEIKTIDELHLPQILHKLIKEKNGLILVTGPTGCGKSTTLAAMIDQINKTTNKHIITLENPIEYLFPNDKSIVHQREIGYDINSFDEGLISILRQDPDVIMIGELRDQLAVNTALKASETGHLVFSTLHTSDVKSTLNRITSLFQVDEATKVRQLLADSLIAIISQQLFPRRDQNGLYPAFEILINTTATANLIRKGEVGQLDSYLMMDQKIGSKPMEKSIEELLKQGIISKQDI